jgi:predicted RNA binding protein YcfA (HicA-like mRNA interferase family)
MPKAPRLTAADAEKLLLSAGFVWVRSKGSHRIYQRGSERVVVPFHPGKVLHPKIVKQITQTIGG